MADTTRMKKEIEPFARAWLSEEPGGHYPDGTTGDIAFRGVFTGFMLCLMMEAL